MLDRDWLDTIKKKEWVESREKAKVNQYNINI